MARGDLVCYSHLRWDFVYQRPQHLMSRAARGQRVFFVEEPIVGRDLDVRVRISAEGVHVCQTTLPADLIDGEALAVQRRLVDAVLADAGVERPVVWHYTPMGEPLSRGLSASLVVYDSMDELSAFKDAPRELRRRERELLDRADLVFTGGQSLYEAKRDRHPSVHAFPSGVDAAHFRRARSEPRPGEPEDLHELPRPRLVYVGVIDERLDLELLDAVAAARPEWSVVLIGPVAKIDPSSLPTRPNIDGLGMRDYAELPAYLAHADVALMPFARNDATRFISPTKTPEYLAAGLPVVSTSIRDVVQPYGNLGLVSIADEPEAFVDACERAIGSQPPRRAVELMLGRLSWDATWAAMSQLMDRALEASERGMEPWTTEARS